MRRVRHGTTDIEYTTLAEMVSVRASLLAELAEVQSVARPRIRRVCVGGKGL